MADALRHRGPDDEGFWRAKDGSIGLAHRRLSIIDIETGHQPITNEDGSVVAIVNGEIYNYVELREQLLDRGHLLRTQSDAEVVVHLYEDHGLDYVSKLRGMFAIAIWDEHQRQLSLSRDRVGKKPLYYSEASDEFIFASEIKGLEAVVAKPLTLDTQSIADYLAWSAVHAPATIYREIKSLRPGEIVTVKNRQVADQKRYWRLELLPKTSISRADAVEELDAHLREAVRLRLRSDVPVGCFLSGGVDSGIITALAADMVSKPLKTITIGFEDDLFDERTEARAVAERFGTDHQEVVIQPRIMEDLPAIARAYDQPFGDASAVPSFYVSQAARRHVKVVLTGDGGDELFAGYRRHVGAWLSRLLLPMEAAPLRLFWRAVSACLPTPRSFRTAYAFSHRLVRGLGMEQDERYLAWTVDVLESTGLSTLIGNKEQCWLDGHSQIASASRLARPSLEAWPGVSGLEKMLVTDFETILPYDHLVKIDIATMAHGLEARSPLLDHVLVEFVGLLPTSTKLNGFRTKPLLRSLAARYLPSDICLAPKRGFEVPLLRWLQGDLAAMRDDVILARDGLLTELFDRAALEKLVSGRSNLGPARWSRSVWHLLMLGLWDRTVRRAPAPAGS